MFSLRLLFSLALTAASSQAVEISIPDGALLGEVNYTVRKNATYYSFKGIPFAQPPVGNLRLASPVPNSPWNGTLDARNYRNECVQFAPSELLGTGALYGDEDCLYINVFTPDYNASGLPVLVWIYGGVFVYGNGSQYGNDYFLEEGLVVVNFNYRLGALGFLSTGDEALPGNWGIKDQVLALKWVQENIVYFGGDPDNVTIFGESAGAVSVHILMQNPRTTGLFQRAIMNSGTSLNLWSLNTRAATIATLTATNLGVWDSNSTVLVDNLRQLDVDTFVRGAWATGWGLFLTDGLRGLPFAPNLEPYSEDAVYVSPSDQQLQAGDFHQVPVLMGFNSQEAVVAGDLVFYVDIYLVYYDVVFELIAPWSLTQNSTRRFAAGSDIKYHYFELESIAQDRQRLINFISADQFNRPIRKAAETMAQFTTVYYYEFGYQGNVSSSSDRTYEGTGHAEDLSYYFYQPSLNYSATDLEVSETIVLLWSNFVKYGNPTPEEDAALNNTLWVPIDPVSSDVNYLSINESVSMQINPKQSDWEFYQGIWDTYSDSTTTLTTY